MKLKSSTLILILVSLPLIVLAPNHHQLADPFGLAETMREYELERDRAEYLRTYEDFKRSLAYLESSDDWRKYNPYGFIGKYQFGKAALDATGYGHVRFLDFIQNPEVFPESDQERAMDRLLRLNEQVLSPFIQEFTGLLFLDSIEITRTGLLAAAHLAGPGNVKRFLESEGSYNPRDRMGTRLSDYLSGFAHLD